MKLKTLAVIVSSIAASSAWSQGYYVDEQSALRLGNAFSGGAASADDASTAFYNPAGLVRLDKELAVNLSAISVSSKTDGEANTFNGTGLQTIEGDDPSASSTDYLPTIYNAFKLDDNNAIGFFVNAPYATGAEIDKDSIARYQATESSITGLDVGFAYSRRINQQFSVGAAIIAQYVEAKTAVAINTAAACLNALGGACPIAGSLGTSTFDGEFSMEGDSLDYGFDIGALYEISPENRIGINYKSAIKHQLEGDAKASSPDATQAIIPNTKASGTADLTTPETLNLSYFHQLGRVSLQADLSWSKWSRFDQLEVKSDNAVIQSLAAEPVEYNWSESYRIAFGGNYTLNQNVILRGGFAFDQTPIGDDDTKVDFAFDDYKALSMGMSYILNSDATLDLAFQHTLTQERAIDQNDLSTAGAHLTGDVKTEVNSFAMGFRWAL